MKHTISFVGAATLLGFVILAVAETSVTASVLNAKPFTGNECDECVRCDSQAHHTLLGCPDPEEYPNVICIIPGDGHSGCDDSHYCYNHGFCIGGGDDAEVAANKPSLADMEQVRLAAVAGNRRKIQEFTTRFPNIIRLVAERDAVQIMDCAGNVVVH